MKGQDIIKQNKTRQEKKRLGKDKDMDKTGTIIDKASFLLPACSDV